MKTSTQPAGPRNREELPPRLEGLVEALFAGIQAAAASPSGTANVAEFLDASQIRLLTKLAKKDGQTPRQFLQGIVSNLTRAATLQSQTLAPAIP